ncbi:hypothetical protein HYW66_00160 [Candidatus Microgenomates bacterium]|nr:hypothetical protein [Candidatus Microgenomates bacterium]
MDGGPPGAIHYNSDQQITVKAVDVQTGNEITLNTTPKTLNCGDATPWWQTRLGDVRAGGSSLTDRIPSSCVGACTPVVSLTNNSAGLVTYKTPPTSDFGSGTASSPNWKVDSQFGGTSYSYELVNNKLGSSATLFNPSSLPTTTGNYKATGDTTIPAAGGAWTIGAGQKLVVLIEGNLTINREIVVPAGSYLAFFVSGDISVDPSIGTTHNNDSGNQLEGIYAANGSFRTGQTVVCNPGNNRLNIGGTVVADADLNGSGNISQQRCLGPRDNLYPSFYVNYRPDFLLNAPPVVQRSGLLWQEVAP